MKTKAVVTMIVCLGLTSTLFAGTIIWPEQAAKDWDAPNAIWESAPGVSVSPPASADYAYILSTNEVTVDSAVTVRRLYVDRSVGAYAAVASTVTIVPGGVFTIGDSNGIAQIGMNIDGGTINVAGGQFLGSIGRSGTYAIRMENDFDGTLNIYNGGLLQLRNDSNIEFENNSECVVNVWDNGLIKFTDGSGFVMGEGADGVTISDTGLIQYVGRDATSEVQILAEAGQLTGISPLTTPLYTAVGSANGVGWYYDGTDTYAFVVPEPVTLILLGFGGMGLLTRRRQP